MIRSWETLKELRVSLIRIITSRLRRVVQALRETRHIRHRDGFRDQFGHASDLVTLSILQIPTNDAFHGIDRLENLVEQRQHRMP